MTGAVLTARGTEDELPDVVEVAVGAAGAGSVVSEVVRPRDCLDRVPCMQREVRELFAFGWFDSRARAVLIGTPFLLCRHVSGCLRDSFLRMALA